MSISPDLRRWMLFVDGENLTIRAQQFADDQGFPLVQGDYYEPDVFVWIPRTIATQRIPETQSNILEILRLQLIAVRSFYYTSVVGDDGRLVDVREALWNLRFSPQVFKKDKRQAKTKGVDIALTKDMLSNAFLDNYDVAILVAGDGDYVPLIEEVKRLGKIVCVGAFSAGGLSRALKLSGDAFLDLGHLFEHTWSGYHKWVTGSQEPPT